MVWIGVKSISFRIFLKFTDILPPKCLIIWGHKSLVGIFCLKKLTSVQRKKDIPFEIKEKERPSNATTEDSVWCKLFRRNHLRLDPFSRFNFLRLLLVSHETDKHTRTISPIQLKVGLPVDGLRMSILCTYSDRLPNKHTVLDRKVV